MEISISEITIEEQIGNGDFSIVYRGKWNERTVALKKIVSLPNPKIKELFNEEVSMLLRRLQHPNIIKIFGVSKSEEDDPIIVTEFENGTLYNYLYKQNIKPPLKRIIELGMDIGNGLIYLHQLVPKIIHSNLKSSNVLLNNEYHAVLTDFGLSAMRTEIMKESNTFGPPQWTAPEIMEKGTFNEKADVYSFGMVMFELATNITPFADMTYLQIIRAINEEQRPKIPDECNPSLKSLIEQCWHQNPNQRPSIIMSVTKLELLKVEKQN